jgi:hypothetical protein
MAQRAILHIIYPRAVDNIGPLHICSLNNATKDSNLGKSRSLDLCVLKSKTRQKYVESSDVYKNWVETLQVPDLHDTIISSYISSQKF